MFIRVTESIFRDWMNECFPNSFSYEGLGLLFNFLEGCENSENREELDVVALNCSYTEASLSDIAKNYSLMYEGDEEYNCDDEDAAEVATQTVYDYETMTDEMLREVVYEYLQENTCLMGITSEDTAVYMSF
jgi:hypothetical protein